MNTEDTFLEVDSLPLITTPARFARDTGVSEHVVRHWVANGAIPIFQLGRR